MPPAGPGLRDGNLTRERRVRLGARGGLRRIAGGVLLAALTLLAACGAASSQPVLTSHDLTGTWSTPNGSRITFSADHRFSAAGIDLAPHFPGCPDLSGSGSWQFLSPAGDTGTYASGSQIAIVFASPVSGLCSGTVTLTSWEINPPAGLCLEFDPDSPCTGTPFTKRE